MMPVASMGTSRITKRDMVVDGYFIPARSVLLAPFDAVHRHPMNWEDPDDFIPVGFPSHNLRVIVSQIIVCCFE